MQAFAQACAAATAPVLPRPRSVAQAKRSQEWPQWELASVAELQSFFAHGVWEEGGCACMPARQRCRVIVCSIASLLGGARRGLWREAHQQPGVDFIETFAPVCSYRTQRMIAVVTAQHGLRLRQFDIKTAFLNGVVEEEVYVRPPAGFEYLAGGPARVLRLRRAMYGLRQAPRAWNKCLEAELTKRGFVQSNADPGLWLLYGENGTVMCMFYVEDGLAAVRSDEEAEALVDLRNPATRGARGCVGHRGTARLGRWHHHSVPRAQGPCSGRGVWRCWAALIGAHVANCLRQPARCPRRRGAC